VRDKKIDYFYEKSPTTIPAPVIPFEAMTPSIMMMMVMILLGCWETKLQQMRFFAVVVSLLVNRAVEEFWRFSRSPLRILWDPIVGPCRVLRVDHGENATAKATHPQFMLIFN